LLPSLTKNMDYPGISILIVTHNRCDALKRCLDSVATQDYPKALLGLAVLDDASNDPTPLEIPKSLARLQEAGFHKAVFLRNESNLQIAASRLKLYQEAGVDSELVLFLDDDAFLEKDCLKSMAGYMAADQSIGLIAPRVVFNHNRGKTAHCAKFVDRYTGIIREKDVSAPVSCDWLVSICQLARKTAFDKSSVFYPGYYTGYEEVELCLRIKRAGYRVVYYPAAQVRHWETEGQFKRERSYYLYRNKIILIRRNFFFVNQITAILFILIFGLPRYCVESMIFHRGICRAEIRLIFLAMWHGLTGKTGKLREGYQ